MLQRLLATLKAKRKDILSAAAAILAVALLYLFFHVSGIGCPIHYATGISCPGCGMTRATMSLFAGNLGAALRWHFMLPAMPAVLLMIAEEGRLFRGPWPNRAAWTLLSAGFILRWSLNLAGILPA